MQVGKDSGLSLFLSSEKANLYFLKQHLNFRKIMGLEAMSVLTCSLGGGHGSLSVQDDTLPRHSSQVVTEGTVRPGDLHGCATVPGPCPLPEP